MCASNASPLARRAHIWLTLQAEQFFFSGELHWVRWFFVDLRWLTHGDDDNDDDDDDGPHNLNKISIAPEPIDSQGVLQPLLS